MKRRSKIALGVAMVLVAVLSYGVFAPPPGPRSMKQFDAVRMGDLESRMWRARYANERVRPFVLLVTMLHEQYHYSWATAASEGFHLARAMAAFGNERSNDDVVLPGLERAYGMAKAWLRAGFDPRQVARAELAWWVARRTPGQNDPERIGALIADQYALLYETDRELVIRSAQLRAEAVALRDAEPAGRDWDTIRRLLQQSYGELLSAFSTRSA